MFYTVLKDRLTFDWTTTDPAPELFIAADSFGQSAVSRNVYRFTSQSQYSFSSMSDVVSPVIMQNGVVVIRRHYCMREDHREGGTESCEVS